MKKAVNLQEEAKKQRGKKAREARECHIQILQKFIEDLRSELE